MIWDNLNKNTKNTNFLFIISNIITNNKKDVTVKVNDIKSIKSIQKKINENDKITFIITTKDMEMLKTL